MKPKMKRELISMSEIMEDLTANMAELPQATLIDVAARLKPIAKHIEALDKYVKDEIVKPELGDQEGTLNGIDFKAVLKEVPTTRLNQKALKEGDPKVHAKYNEDVVDLRVSFELR